MLPSLGFDRTVHALGVMPAAANPSRIVGTIAMTAVLIVGLMEAAQAGRRRLSTAALLFQITELGGKVIFGTVIIVVGMFLARILAGLVGSSTGEAGYAQTIVKYAIIALFTAIGLTFMGLADQIVMLAFGLILGSAAVATAMAFGLGGRDAAARMLDEWHAGQMPPSAAATAAAPQARHAARRRQPAAVGVIATAVSQAASRSTGRARRDGGTRASRLPRREAARPRALSGPAMSGRAARCWTGCWRGPTRNRPCSASTSASPRRLSSAAPICPGEADVPATAREFWAYVDRLSDDEDLGAASFLEHVHRRHFYFGIADGVKADFVHFRRCDAALNAQGGRKTASAYDAIGAAQVAKASFSGMRLLHRLDGKVAIWPMDPLPDEGSAVVEIYTRIYIRNAGLSGQENPQPRRTQRALAALGLACRSASTIEPNDHQTDALITAAGMRAHLANPQPSRRRA